MKNLDKYFDDVYAGEFFRLACACAPVMCLGICFSETILNVGAVIGLLFALCLVARVVWLIGHEASTDAGVHEGVSRLLSYPYIILLCALVFQALGGRESIAIFGYVCAGVVAADALLKSRKIALF